MGSLWPLLGVWACSTGDDKGTGSEPADTDGSTETTPPLVDTDVPPATGSTADTSVAPIDLAVVFPSLIATTVVRGSDQNDNAGGNVGDVGDLDGDGAADLVMTSVVGGRAWLFLGPLPPGEVLLDDADATFELDSPVYDAVPTGDITADGHRDFVLPSTDAFGRAGAVYVLDGTHLGPTPIADARATLVGSPGSNASHGGVAAGDLTGDGIDDLVVGATENGYIETDAWIVVGPISGTGALDDHLHLRDPAHAFGDKDLVVHDLDADGIGDLVVALPNVADLPDRSGANVFFGPITGDLETDAPDVRITGVCDWGDEPAVGDVDGDGHPDLALGAYYCDLDAAHQEAGRVYLFRGPFLADQDGDDAAAVVAGQRDGERLGYILEPAGDVDDDGDDDLLVAAAGTGAWPWVGAAFLFLDLAGSSSDADAATVFPSEFPEQLVGSAIHATADLDGDGYRDLAIGAVGDATRGPESGATYVISTSLWP